MPRTRFDRYAAPKRPATDRPKALILERMQAGNIGGKQMADALGVSPSTWTNRKQQHTDLWPLGELLKACEFLGVELEDLRSAIRYGSKWVTP